MIDFYQLHWAPKDACLYEELYELKESGKAWFVGVSLYSTNDIEHMLEHTEIDGFQVALSLVDPLPFVTCLDRIRGRRPAIVARSSLKSGFLSGKFSRGVDFSSAADHRAELSRPDVDRILDLVDAFRVLEQGSGSLTRAAALYPLSFPEISTEILGTKSASQAQENFGCISGSTLTASELEAIAEVQETEGLLREGALSSMRVAFRRIRSLLVRADARR